MKLQDFKGKREKSIVIAKAEKFEKLDGCTLLEVNDIMPITSIAIGTRTVEIDGADTTIKNLIVEFNKEKVAFNFSKAFDVEEFEAGDEDLLMNSRFYVRNKFADGQKEDEEPAGARYISFGKPSSLTFEDVTVLVGDEPKVNTK